MFKAVKIIVLLALVICVAVGVYVLVRGSGGGASGIPGELRSGAAGDGAPATEAVQP